MLALRCAGCKKQVGPSSQSIIPLRPKKLAMPNMPPNKRPPMPAPAGSPDTLGLQGTACQIDQFAATSPLPPWTQDGQNGSVVCFDLLFKSQQSLQMDGSINHMKAKITNNLVILGPQSFKLIRCLNHSHRNAMSCKGRLKL